MKKTSSWILRVLPIFVIVFLLVGCGNSEAGSTDSNASETDANADSSAEGQALIVGLDDTFPPMGFRDDNGDIVGFDIDIANEIGDRLGYKMEFQAIDWSLKETELEAGNIDLIWNGYTITPEREEKVLFSEPYMENSQMIVVPADSDIQSKEDLKGKVVAAQQSSSAVDAINNDDSSFPQDFANGEVVQYPSNNDVFNDLINGRADAIVVDETMGRYYMSLNEDFDYRVLEDNFGEEYYAVGMRKDDTDFKKEFDQALQEMKDDGTYDEIYGKWFSES